MIHTHLHYRDTDEWHSGKVIVSLMTAEDGSETQIKALTWLDSCQENGVLPPAILPT